MDLLKVDNDIIDNDKYLMKWIVLLSLGTIARKFPVKEQKFTLELMPKSETLKQLF